MSSKKQEKKINSLLKQIVKKSIYEAINLATLQEDDETEEKEKSDDSSKKEDKPVEKQAAPIDLVSKEDLTLQIVQDELNTMRSGRSVDNAVVSSELEKYYNSLSSDERMDLYTYLTALAKIMTGEVAAEDAPDPDDAKDAGDTEDKKPEKKVTDVAKSETPPEEDTAPPVKVSGKSDNTNESLKTFIKTLLTEEL